MKNLSQQISKNLKNKVQGFKRDFSISDAGRIVFSADGVIKIEGLSSVRLGELIEIEGKTKAIVLNLEEEETGAIVLGEENEARVGQIVKSTGHIVEVGVGNALLGRVVDPLGQPIDGMGELKTKKFRPIEAIGPDIGARGKVNEPLATGLIAVDSMIPIGKGQRELIIGDRQTGKTALAIDAILNQKGKDVICIYVAIGQKAAAIANIVHILNENGAMDYCVLVCSTAHDSSPLQYIAPYCGCAIGEEFMFAGKDVLIVYDDLSKHAAAYRAMSLLLKRPPGREAYPGDIFYLHSRLLERAAKLSPQNGGGSMTALPIVETQGSDISAYIPTNVISITDGQIYLESELFNAGIRPAINVGLSVSRVGGAAQIKAMRKVSGKLRLDLSQYRELAIFAQFGSDLDSATQKMLEQGERTTETLKQGQYAPLDTAHQVVLLYVTMKEMLIGLQAQDVRRFNTQFCNFVDANYANIIESINTTGDLSDETMKQIEQAAQQYLDYFFAENK